MATPVRFGEPPLRRATKYDWEAVAEALKKKPNEWAEVFTNDRYSLVASVAYGSVAAFRADDDGYFETMTSNNADVMESDGLIRRHCDLWMRYVPTTKTSKRKK